MRIGANNRNRFIKSSLSRFGRDERGVVALIFAMLAFALVGIAGVAIDYLRAVTAKARIQHAVDAAALAGATAARNGVDAATTSSMVQTIFNANLGGGAPTPQIKIEKAGTATLVSVSAQHEVQTVIGQILGVKTVPVGATGKAQAEPGPTGSIAAMNLSGSGMIYNDPHVLYIGTNGHVASFMTPCTPNKWTNIVSDGGFQWNTVCRADALYFAGSWVKAGDHTISYMPFMDRGFLVGGANVKGDDCSRITPKAFACGIAAPATLIIDGKEIDPAQYGGQGIFTIVNDTANDVIIKAQVSSYPIDPYFGATPPAVHNYIAVYVKTAHYELTLILGHMFQDAWVEVMNAGMCGPPGGYYGAIINGGFGADKIENYTIPTPDQIGSQYGWKPTCNGGGQTSRLMR